MSTAVKNVSVIVPCYNHERFVEECLKSLDAQEGEGLEIIIVDDGSTDRTWKKIERFEFSRRHEVHLVRTENRGAHAALNEGLARATGRWIALCNSDDLFAPARVATLLEATARAKARFAFSGVWFVNPAGRNVTHHLAYARELHARQLEIGDFPSVGWALMPTNVAISTGNFFFERSLVKEIGYFRPYRLVHDWDFILRALLVTEPLYVPERLYGYRLHATNSFTELVTTVAARECPELMRRYWKAAVSSRPKNPLAPSPHNWPVFSDVFVQEHRYEQYLTGWDSIDEPFYAPPGASLTPLEQRG